MTVLRGALKKTNLVTCGGFNPRVMFLSSRGPLRHLIEAHFQHISPRRGVPALLIPVFFLVKFVVAERVTRPINGGF